MDREVPQGRDALVPVTSLEEFFRDSVDAALAANHVAVEHETARYVVGLLTLFARSEALYETCEGAPGQRPLALMLADAARAGRAADRHFALQRLGDVSLFMAGFFAEWLHHRAVGLDYYVNMGGGAYRSLASGLRGRATAAIFAELGAKFAEMVDVLNEVRESARGSPERDALRLYEAWLKCGSPRAARLLRDAGIEPTRQAQSRYQH